MRRRTPRWFPLDRLWLLVAIGVLALLIVAVGIALILDGDDGAGGPTATTTALPATPSGPSVGTPPVAATPIASPMATPFGSPVASPSAASVGCLERCLVRMIDTPAGRQSLTQVGTRPVYAHDGQMWAAVPVPRLGDLEPAGDVTIVADAVATRPLHVMRVRDGQDPAPILAAGDVIDRVDNQFIVRVPEIPFVASSLTNLGIWVEKFPPYPPPNAKVIDPAALLAIDDLGELSAAVSIENMEVTVAELTRMGTGELDAGTRYYAAPGNVEAAEYIFNRFSTYGMDVHYEDFLTNDGYLAINVIGELPGLDDSERYLVLAHFDTINDADGEVSPGADDNATGIAAMFEVARILSRYQLAHPVRFLATNAEEVGILGAPAFAQNAADQRIDYTGAYNIDAVGSAANGRTLILNADEASIWLEDVLIEMNDQYGLGQELLVRQNPAIVADDNSLREYGIPTVLLARELYGWSATHHTEEDVISTVDFPNVQAVAQLVVLAIGSLVQP